MLYGESYKILSEAASADLLDPEVDQEVKDVVEDLEDTLTTNVEEVPADDKFSNNAVLSPEDLKECCTLWESGDGRYFADIRDIIRICEAEEEETGEPADAGEVAAEIENALNESKAGKKDGKAKKKAKGLADAIKDLKEKGIKVARVDKKKK